MDSMNTAALRSQGILGQLTRDLHRVKFQQDVHGNNVAVTRCLLPRYCKNKKKLESVCGLVVNHTKNEKCAGAYAVIAVVGRRVMRRLLEEETGSSELTRHLGPFGENGRIFTPTALKNMYVWLGQRTMDISHFGTHIIRSNHATAMAMYCYRHGLDMNHQAVKDLFALARHGDTERLRFYTQVKADSPSLCPIMTCFGGVNASLRELSTEGIGDQAAGENIEKPSDIREVRLSGIFAFEDVTEAGAEASVRGKSVGGNGVSGASDVMDEDERALAKKLRMALMRAELEKAEAKKTVVEKNVESGCGEKRGGRAADLAGAKATKTVVEKVVESGCGEKGGGRAAEFEYRKTAFSRVNQLVLETSKKTQDSRGQQINRGTLAFLKNDQRTLRVAFHEHVKGFLYSQNTGERKFLDEFYLKLKEKSLKFRPGSKAEAYRTARKMEWSYHNWSSGDVRIASQEKKRRGGENPARKRRAGLSTDKKDEE